MKICVIADLHGSDKWRDVVKREQNSVDRFIFLGDYFDSKGEEIPYSEQVKNFEQLREYAALCANVDLLIGNHELHYIGGTPSRGYSDELYLMVTDMVMEMVSTKELQLCAKYGRYLLSHAGVSVVWMEEHSIAEYSELNDFFHSFPLEVDFVGREGCSHRGDDPFQSPLWIRPPSLVQGARLDTHQIVGHTPVTEIEAVESEGCKFIFCDTEQREYLIIDTITEEEFIKNI